MTMPTDVIRSTSSPETSTLWGGLIRTGLAIAGGGGLGAGLVPWVDTLSNVTPEQWSGFISAGMPIAGLVASVGAGAWSRWQKYQAAKANHVNNIASAKAGVAVTVAAL